jgi:hypothetical protein
MEQTTPTSGYISIDDLLIKKYGHTDVMKMDFPDMRNKTVFLDKRGNDISKGILSYAQAEEQIENFLNTPLP